LSVIIKYVTNKISRHRAISLTMLLMSLVIAVINPFQKEGNQGYYGIKPTPSWVDEISYPNYNPKADKEK
jgi:hypothetical protein